MGLSLDIPFYVWDAISGGETYYNAEAVRHMQAKYKSDLEHGVTLYRCEDEARITYDAETSQFIATLPE